MLHSRLQRLLSRRHLSRLKKISQPALKLAEAVRALSDDALAAAFTAQRHSDPHNLPHALALVREASRRALGLEPFEEQLQGAAALFQGVIVEMKTGEGKTLTVALAAAIAALSRQGVHIATVNPYLAQRDADAMRPLFAFLGLTVGATLPGQSPEEKRAAYACDVTYAVHSELGFDYLRDHLVAALDDKVQRGQAFAIVDEADSILIDEARTPLIISQPASTDDRLYRVADQLARSLTAGQDFEVDEKQYLALLTEAGLNKVEQQLLQGQWIPHKGSLYQPEGLHLFRYLTAALKAHTLFRRDRDYILRGDEIVIIDSGTGRLLEGRQWQDGLHQAIEAKERLPIKPENETAAEITYQSLFRLYGRLAGLTGTAMAAAEEFEAMYNLVVVPVPTHRPVVRQDLPDQLYRNKALKFQAIVQEVKTRAQAGQPILLGTASVGESEELSHYLARAGVPHQVLNARQNEQEAQIIADAGLPGAVTVATNMAGRGTDIVLGGHTERDVAWTERHARVMAAGGLHVIGTTRHESRRVDDQLRGRAGRQGDPGSSQFYLCPEDDLLRLFGAERLERLFRLVGVSEEALTGPLLDRAVASAQRRVEGQHYDARKTLARFEGVMAEQREAVYALRRDILAGTLDAHYGDGLLAETAQHWAEACLDPNDVPDNWKVKELKQVLEQDLGVTAPVIKWAMVDQLEQRDIVQRVQQACLTYYREKREDLPTLSTREQRALVAVLDQLWRGHLTHLAGLREGIHLRSYAQQDPATAFRKEAFESFLSFRKNYVMMAAVALTSPFRQPPRDSGQPVLEVPADEEESPTVSDKPERAGPRVGRNTACPCGSTLRYKHCHGRLGADAATE